MLPDSLPNPPEPICHECAHSNNVHGWPETASGEVALVLHGAVAAGGRHILRHDGRLYSRFNGGVSSCAVDAETT